MVVGRILHEALQIVCLVNLVPQQSDLERRGNFPIIFYNKHTPRELGASIELEFSFTEDGEQ